MPKKIKLNLEELSIKSFSTSLNSHTKGGVHHTDYLCWTDASCPTEGTCWSDCKCTGVSTDN